MVATHPIDDGGAAPTRNASRAGFGRLLAGYGAALAIAPYVALKAAWVAGIPWGWEDAGVIDGAAMVAGDAVTGAMALVGALLALAFTHRWGLRAPAWLVVFPAWVGTGLLVPVVAGLPVYGLLVAAGRLQNPDADGRASWWTFPLVYGTFFFLGIGLIASGAFYLHDRWGAVLGGVVGDGGRGATASLQAILARVAAAVAGCLGALNLYWLLGGTVGLDPRRLGERDYVFYQGNAVGAVAAGCAAAGLLMMTGRLGRGTPFRVALALAGVGGAVLFAQGTLNLAFGWLITATGSIGNLGTEVPVPQRRVVFDIVNFFGVVGSSLGGVVVLVHLAERGVALAGAAGRDGPRARLSHDHAPASGGSVAPRTGRGRVGVGHSLDGGTDHGGWGHGQAGAGNGEAPEWGVELPDGVLARFVRKETVPPKRSSWRVATAWLWRDSGSAWPAGGMPLDVAPDAVVPAALPARRGDSARSWAASPHRPSRASRSAPTACRRRLGDRLPSMGARSQDRPLRLPQPPDPGPRRDRERSTRPDRKAPGARSGRRRETARGTRSS